MRITIATIGSTGDVLPYVGLGAHLAEHGHAVTIATHRSYRPAVHNARLTHFTLPTEPRDLLTPDVAERMRRGGRRAAKAVEAAFTPHVWDLAAAVDAAASKADLVVLSPMAWTGRHSAEGNGIPSMGVHLQPLAPTRAFAPPTLTSRSLGGAVNVRLGAKLQLMMVQPHLSVVNDLRAGHGLAPTTLAAELDTSARWPVLHGFSEHVLPRPADWHRGLTVTGYWWPPEPHGWCPDPVLVDFLGSGPTPVFVGFGSTSPMDPEELGRLVARVTERLRVRAVVQSGWADLTSRAGHIINVGDVPHTWLFPRMRAVVHHGGAGTTAAALRAGVPSVTVPLGLDQPFWARRVYAVGAGTRPIPARRLTDNALEATLARAITDRSLISTSRRVSALLARENGPERARQPIERALL